MSQSKNKFTPDELVAICPAIVVLVFPAPTVKQTFLEAYQFQCESWTQFLQPRMYRRP